MKEDIKALGLTEEDFQALLGDIKKRREKYRESLDLDKENEIKKEDRIAREALEKFIKNKAVLVAMK